MCSTIVKVKIYPDLENTIIAEVNTALVKEVLEVLKASLRLQGQYAIVKNNKILSNDEFINNQDEILLIPIVESG